MSCECMWMCVRMKYFFEKKMAKLQQLLMESIENWFVAPLRAHQRAREEKNPQKQCHCVKMWLGVHSSSRDTHTRTSLYRAANLFDDKKNSNNNNWCQWILDWFTFFCIYFVLFRRSAHIDGLTRATDILNFRFTLIRSLGPYDLQWFIPLKSEEQFHTHTDKFIWWRFAISF